ncbi:hypothetical protein HYY72_03970 [Candidatus Woesearchaeota archaeon]|nr:hypothetical protein [Candidatus Woesearchaeota archaeon]
MRRVFFIDVDFTAANFDYSAGDKAVCNGILGLFPGREDACSLFIGLFSAMLGHLYSRESPLSLEFMRFIDSASVVSPKGMKPDLMYSRELFLKFVSVKCGLELDGNDIIRIVDEYWKAIVSSTVIYDDALRFFRKADDRFIIAGGDGRLKFEKGDFIYEPDYSRGRRLERTRAIGLSGFFDDEKVLIGDPVRKGSPEFWEMCMKAAGLADKQEGIVVDDSISIVSSAMDFGFKGVLMDRKGIYGSSVGADEVIASFDELEV